MSYEAIETQRANAQWGILQRFGEAYSKVEQGLTAKFSDPQIRRVAAARISLEHAVLQTALEKGVPTQQVAAAVVAAKPEQQAMMVREGRAAMERAYGLAPDVVVSALAAKVVEVPMPRGLASNPEFDKMMDKARNLVSAIVQDQYANRGRFADHGERSSFVELANDSSVAASNRVELATRLAFIESAIDAAVSHGKLPETNAKMLKERVEAMVFQPRPPQSLDYSPEFRKFYDGRGADMRIDVMREVRGITQSRAITEIATKIDATVIKPPPIRQQDELQR